MHIESAKFVKSVVGPDSIFKDGKPQVAFIGRSNAGKSSTINSLTRQPGLARTSSFPGRTKELNVFLINKTQYLVDLPGYGFTKTARKHRDEFQGLMFWYLFESEYVQKKVIMVIDANVGFTPDDLEMLYSLEEAGKEILIAANKIDKIKPSEYKKKMDIIETKAGIHKVIPYSAEKGTGSKALVSAMLS